MNAAHRIDFGERYWRILIGLWLFHFVHVVYDRWMHLREALRRYPGLETIVLARGSFRTPGDTHEAVPWSCEDTYNLQLYSELLGVMGHVPGKVFRLRDVMRLLRANPELLEINRERVETYAAHTANYPPARLLSPVERPS